MARELGLYEGRELSASPIGDDGYGKLGLPLELLPVGNERNETKPLGVYGADTQVGRDVVTGKSFEPQGRCMRVAMANMQRCGARGRQPPNNYDVIGILKQSIQVALEAGQHASLSHPFYCCGSQHCPTTSRPVQTTRRV